jgi:ABC-type glycerol-3-phosphate transport system permease component
MLLVFVFLQRFFMSGITAGGREVRGIDDRA